MDFRDHVRALWALRVPLVLVAALLALGVAGYQATRPATQTSTVALDVVAAPGADGAADATTTAADRYALVGTGSAVLDAVAQQTGVSRADVTAAVTVTAASADQLEVTATGRDAATARALVTAEAQALVAAVDTQERDRRDQDVAGLQSRLSDVATRLAAVPAGTDPGGVRTALTVQLNTLATAIGTRQSQIPPRLSQDGAPTEVSVAGGALRKGVLTFLLALVLLGEGAVALLRLQGRLLRGNWAGQVQELTGSPLLSVVLVTGRGRLEPSGGLRAHLALRKVTGPDGLTLLPFVEDLAARRLAREIARSARALGRPGLVVDASHWRTERADAGGQVGEETLEEGAREVVLHSGRAPLDSMVREEEYVVLYGPPAADLHGTVALALLGSAPVLVLDSRSARVKGVREWAQVLREAGCAPVGVIVLDRRFGVGPLPRPSARAAAPAQAPAPSPTPAP